MELDDRQQRGRWLPIAVLAGIAVVLFILDSTGNLDGALNLLRNPMTGILSFTSAQTDKVADALSGPRDIQEAQQQIEALQGQVDFLERENEQLRAIEGEYQLLLELFGQTREKPNIDRVVATVIARDTSPTFRSLVIDKGTDDGVQVGMPVEGPRGLVGQIFRATHNQAQVILMTDNTSSIPARLGSSRATGVVHGGGAGGVMTMDWINLDAVIAPGEVVLTSGLAGESPAGMQINRFPPDLVMGRVIEIHRSEAELFQRAIVQPATNFEALEAVFVITSVPSIDTGVFDEVPGQ